MAAYRRWRAHAVAVHLQEVVGSRPTCRRCEPLPGRPCYGTQLSLIFESSASPRVPASATDTQQSLAQEEHVSGSALFIAVFLACLVEAVEALTIILAAGTGRDWRSAITGLVAGLAVLAVLVAILGPAVAALPLSGLRLFVGGVLLIFGLQWLRKAILRASGNKALHDEDLIFNTQLAAGRQITPQAKAFVHDWYAFTLSFKGVVLEGLEVVFIVLTFGSNQKNVPLAALAGVVAVLVVAAAGLAVRAPLARVPENTMKFVVGVMLTSFGMFWGAEGAGAHWPGADASLLAIIPAVAVVALLLVVAFRRPPQASRGPKTRPAKAAS